MLMLLVRGSRAKIPLGYCEGPAFIAKSTCCWQVGRMGEIGLCATESSL